MEHEASKGDVMETGKRLSQALVVTSQTSESRGPCKASFNHPAARQQYEAALGLGVLDHRQLDTVGLSRLFCILSSVALIHIRQCHTLVGKVLYRLRQFFHLRPVLLIGRGDMQGQQMSQGIDCRMHLGPFASLGAVVSRTVTLNVLELLLPALSVAVHVTVVAPSANVVPDAGAHVAVPAPSTVSLQLGLV